MLAAPSYVTSAKRLTMPIVNTKANADDPAVATIVSFVMPVVDEDHFVAPAPQRYGTTPRHWPPHSNVAPRHECPLMQLSHVSAFRSAARSVIARC